MISQFPFNGESPRRLIIAESGTPAEVLDKLQRLAAVAEIKRGAFHSDAAGSPSETIDWDRYGQIMAERRKREATQE